MERDKQESGDRLVELGSVTRDTQGDGGIYWETHGMRPFPGICDD
jgi:hypothetical protein